jgi:hypothetical protein
MSESLRISRFFRAIIKDWIKFSKKEWLPWVLNCNLSLGQIVHDLNRTRTEKVKNKTKVLVVKPKRPSSRVEVFLTSEKQILRGFEKPWEDMKSFTGDNKNVSFANILDVRNRYKRLLTLQWEVVQKFTAPLTKRQKLFREFIGKARVTLNRSNFEKFVLETGQSSSPSISILWDLSPIPIIKAAKVTLTNDELWLISSLNFTSLSVKQQLILDQSLILKGPISEFISFISGQKALTEDNDKFIDVKKDLDAL